MKEGKDKMPPGFKPSPLGPIPIDWEISELKFFAELEKGKYTPVKTENIKCLELEHFEQATGNIIGWTDSSLQKSTKNKFKKGHVLFGKLRPYLKKYWFAQFDGVCSSEVWVINSKGKKSTNEFLFQLVQHNHFLQVTNVTSGTKMPRADWDYMSSFPFILPPVPEQTAIANCLSTWDKAIEKTQALLEQKEKRKKWLMQMLLTGKKRLKGFENEKWKEYHLGSLGETYSGLFGKTKDDFGVGAPFITYMNVFANHVIDVANVGFVNIKKGESQKKAMYGDIFFTVSSETQDEVGMASVLLEHVEELYLNSFCFGFRLFDFKTLLPEFSCYFLRGEDIREEILKLSQGATRYNLSKTNLMKLNIKLPPIQEQKAISKVLHGIDNEIRIIKMKLDKLKQQKQGLMQVLLTGKKRLKIKK